MSTKDKNSESLAECIVKGMLGKDAFSQWLNIELLEVGPGRAVVQMKVRKEMLNGFSVAHGGIAFSLADSALAFASNTHGKISMSIENSISYLEQVKAGDILTAVAEEEKEGKTIGHYIVRVSKKDAELVAIFRGTVFRTDKLHSEGEL